MQTYKNIAKGFRKETFPTDFSIELSNLIKSLCRKKAEERLPMQSGGIKNLQEHPWYQGISFILIEQRKADVPYVPPPPDFDKFRLRGLSSEIQEFDNKVA